MTESFVAPELQGKLDNADLFETINHLDGEPYREVAARRTIRTRIGDEYYFAKIHFGVGWIEILKNLFSGRLPVLGAGNEWRALRKLAAVGVDSLEPVAFCEEGFNPARKRSAILTRALEGTVSLEDYQPKSSPEKFRLTIQLARMARRMHAAGVNHRDFYLCHFLWDGQCDADGFPRLHVIDLHRAQIRRSVPRRWLVKDLGGLLFSALEFNLQHRDVLRFIREYEDGSLRLALSRKQFWRDVLDRARKLYLQDHDSTPEFLETLYQRL